MLIGLIYALANLQRDLDIILAVHKWKTCLVYVDDAVVFSKSVDCHLEQLDLVLAALRKSGVTFQRSK